jgi:hypothetical protein
MVHWRKMIPLNDSILEEDIDRLSNFVWDRIQLETC